VVNFTSAFAPMFVTQKMFKSKINEQKSFAQNFCTKKAALKMLVKFTPAVYVYHDRKKMPNQLFS
jgi:hypothetical protein